MTSLPQELENLKNFHLLSTENFSELVDMVHTKNALSTFNFAWYFSPFDDGYLYFNMKNGQTADIFIGLGGSVLETLFSMLLCTSMDNVKYKLKEENWIDIETRVKLPRPKGRRFLTEKK